MKIETKKEHFTNPLYLESGRILEPYDLVYETYGELNSEKSNVIVVTHALTGSHHAAGKYEGDRKSGWWDSLIGDNKAIDTKSYFVICVNTIASCFGSTSPKDGELPSYKPYRLRFPVITISDMVKAQIILFDRLGIKKVEAIIGGSMGGMQSLCFAIEYPNFANKIFVLAATHSASSWVIAFNKVAREAIVKDPKFKNGNYDFDEIKRNGMDGLATGRMCGFLTYLSPTTMDNKFNRKHVKTDGLYEMFGRFEVERYLDYNGANFPKYFDPLSYLYLTKAINIFDISREFGSISASLDQIKSKLHLISFKGDMLFFPKEMKEIHNTMISIGKENQVTYLEVDSDYGHDAFLVETNKFDIYIKKLLEEK